MDPFLRRLLRASLIAVALCGAAVTHGQAPAAVASQLDVDKIFGKWSSSTPGCAVAASVGGQRVVSTAYGLADLEHDVKNTADTIFEAGSVSKQFTAAAVLLLARDGRLSLDDPVRKHIPELRDYGAPLLVRHMLNHTSGLRDWGSVEGIAGWPRTTRVNTHAHVLEILARQRALNFTPGTRWSYSNSGYNLAAVLVARVSGMPFAEFTRTRIFEPLGMTRTSWRDDHTRIVKGRAIAYENRQGNFHIDMPFENVHGNAGLLTTVGDLLKWNDNFTSPKVGDAGFVAELQQPGRFNDRRAHEYAFGLTVGTYKGVRQVDHSGSTAGYRAHLSRYPDQRVSVAVLCNVSSGDATRSARAVADELLADHLAPSEPKATHPLTGAEASRIVGRYRNNTRGVPVTIVREGNGVRLERGAELFALSPTRFVTTSRQTWEFDGSNGAKVTDAFGTVDTLDRVAPAKPTVEQLKAFEGVYVSDEAEAALTVEVDGDSLVIKRRPDTTIRATPAYADAFAAGSLGVVIFRRGPDGSVTTLTVSQDRVWDLRFARRPDPRGSNQ
jgi:CubicO group peptidase (beta-lactamase class C family)